MSPTSVMIKLLERILTECPPAFDRQQMIMGSQHIFAHANLIICLSFFTITKKIDKDRAEDIIYADFSKALNNVQHGSLKSQGDPANWIYNWLDGRRAQSDGGKLIFRLDACDQWCAPGIGAGHVAVCLFKK